MLYGEDGDDEEEDDDEWVSPWCFDHHHAAAAVVVSGVANRVSLFSISTGLPQNLYTMVHTETGGSRINSRALLHGVERARRLR